MKWFDNIENKLTQILPHEKMENWWKHKKIRYVYKCMFNMNFHTSNGAKNLTFIHSMIEKCKNLKIKIKNQLTYIGNTKLIISYLSGTFQFAKSWKKGSLFIYIKYNYNILHNRICFYEYKKQWKCVSLLFL